MYKRQARLIRLIMAAAICLCCPKFVPAIDETGMSKEQIKQFLLTAKVVGIKDTSKGITHPSRLTLSDGKITHDASFQAVDERKMVQHLASGAIELNFVDSYKYNIAAYALAELLGLDQMLPVYVERKWQGKVGSLSWWLPVMMDEADRYKRKIHPPDPDAWNQQMYRIRVFDQLIYDTDPNLTNVLISPDWKIWRIDFTRAFRVHHELQNPKELTHCDRQLFDKLKALDEREVAAKTKGYLNKPEVQAVMARRDKIVAYIQKLMGEQGEQAVLY